MTAPGGRAVEGLSTSHERAGFDCGDEGLNDYLQRYASQDVRRGVARVFVALDTDERTVIGYYSLSATSLSHADLPDEQQKKLPRYPVPAALIGRLAVDRKAQGTRLGEFLLLDAMERTLIASETLGIHALAVDALNDRAARYYERYGFIRLSERPERLFLPLATLRRL